MGRGLVHSSAARAGRRFAIRLSHRLRPLEPPDGSRPGLVITGAAGTVGRVLRAELADGYSLRTIDQLPAEGIDLAADVRRSERMQKAFAGASAVVELAANPSLRTSWEQVLANNLAAALGTLEAARRAGVPRVVVASSNHVTGFYRQDEVIDTLAPQRPDSYYGLSKAFGEQLAQFYFDRYGMETVCLRIGSSFPEPKDRRMLATWLGYDDLEQLVRRAMFVPNVKCTIVYGVSANRDVWWDNSHAAHLGYAPTQTSELWRERIERAEPPRAEDDPVRVYQGGAFVTTGPFGD